MNPAEHRVCVEQKIGQATKPTDQKQSEEPVDRMVTLMGGVEVVVTLAAEQLDGAPLKGTVTETIFLRQLPIKEFPRVRRALSDEVALAAIYCGKEIGWAERLLPASHELVIEQGERINRDFFSRWSARMEEREKTVKQDPEFLARIMESMLRVNPEFGRELLKKINPAGSGSVSGTG